MIEIKNLSHTLGTKAVLKDIDLVLSDNKIFGLVGVNGAGKSTLLRCMSAVYTPDSGSVEYSFPKAIPITTEMGDFLEPSVNEKFYNDSPKAQALIDRLIDDGKLPTQAFRKCGE